eukprot:NODE_7648_length_755_cov_30.482595_g7034_i0.p1 GENE.NODE_7648_length_755_cov_30.482595_g7034_i0~~NODE_7648_length_755_cov_30.482595_g7034_i0.p1  ORF type:complete len:136 (+),score=12.60 NODE_7648_length_755_cov_30.482595_g7034_i0:247-654(+)
MVRFSIYDFLLPGNRVYVEVLAKTMIEICFATPVTVAMGVSLNELFKRDGSLITVKRRIQQEYIKVLLAVFSGKWLSILITMCGPSPMLKFLVGMVISNLLNIYTSWRINTTLDSSKKPQIEDITESNPKETKVD